MTEKILPVYAWVELHYSPQYLMHVAEELRANLSGVVDADGAMSPSDKLATAAINALVAAGDHICRLENHIRKVDPNAAELEVDYGKAN